MRFILKDEGTAGAVISNETGICHVDTGVSNNGTHNGTGRSY